MRSRPLLPLLLALVVVLPLMADNTLRGRRLRPASTASAPSAPTATPVDTVRFPADTLVELSGYDKPLRSRRESLLVTNRLPSPLTSLVISITYRDLQGRELHSADVEVRSYIPAGSTRLVSFPSWDCQQSYYYHLGQRPRTSGVTPYTVSCVVKAVTTEQ